MDILLKDVPDELVKKLDRLADKDRRSRSSQILYILEQSFKEVSK